jgi:hypothetical protein
MCILPPDGSIPSVLNGNIIKAPSKENFFNKLNCAVVLTLMFKL